MKRIQWIPAALSTVLLFWSALAAADNSLAALKRIYIATVELPKKPDIVGQGGVWAALLGGPLAGLVADAGNNDIETAYVQFLERNNIDVGADIAFEVMDQLSAKGYEVVGAPDQADATLKVHVGNYGFVSLIGSDGSIPVLGATFILSNQEGKRIWVKQPLWFTIKEIPKTVQAHPLPDYFNDPKLLASQMRKVNAMVISVALKKL